MLQQLSTDGEMQQRNNLLMSRFTGKEKSILSDEVSKLPGPEK